MSGLRLVLCGLVAFSLSACSTFRIAYNYADWYLTREIAAYVCPSARQRQQLHREIQSVFRWHRRHELPRYARSFRRVAHRLDRGPVTAELVQQAYDVVEQAIKRATGHLAPRVVGLGSNLPHQQADCIARKLSSWRREKLDEIGDDPRPYRVNAGKKLLKQIETWTGDLTDTQRHLVLDRLPSHREARAAIIARYNKGMRLVGALKSAKPAMKRAWLRSWITERFALYDKAERALMKRRDARHRADFVQLLLTLNKKQRAHLASELRDYARDFERLAHGD